MKTKNKKQQLGGSLVRTTQQNKIPVYCWTTLFHTYIKQAKKRKKIKINSNFIDRKKKEKPFLSLALPPHTNHDLWYS